MGTKARHFSPAERAAAVARHPAETFPQIARSLGCTPAAVRKWAKDAAGSVANVAPPAAPLDAPVPAAPPVEVAAAPASPPGLVEALAVVNGATVPAVGAPAASSAAPIAPGPNGPTLDGKTLVSVFESLNGTAVHLSAAVMRAGLTRDELRPLAKFSEEERLALEAFAPYATDDVAAIMDKYPRAMGWVFLGFAAVVGFVHVRGVVTLAQEKRAERATEVVDARASS